MDVQLEHSVQEIKRLQRCISDLGNLLALPAIWSANEPAQIVPTLLDSLLRVLGLAFTYARFKDPVESVFIEVLRVADAYRPRVQSETIREALGRHMGSDFEEALAFAHPRLGNEDISIFPVLLGAKGEIGMIVVGSDRADFPGETESLLLSVAANQASIGLREAGLLSEQKRISNELDRRVAERTRELAVTNQELRREIAAGKLKEEKLRLNEEALRLAHMRIARNEERWRSVFENSAIGVALTDLNGQFIATNPVYQKMLGYTEEELQQIRFLDITVEEDRAHNWTLTEELLGGKRRQFQIEKQYRRKNGSLVWVRNSVSLVPGTERVPRFLMALSEDITERKQAEAAIRASEFKLRQVIDTIPTLAWCNLPDGPNEFLNKRWHEYTGLSPEESDGWGWQVAFHPEDLPPVMKKWHELLASGEPGEIEARLRRYDGVYRWFLIRAEPLRDEAGTIVRWYGTSTDIDDRKRAEEQLRRSETFLAEGQRLSLTGSFSWRVATDEIMWSEQLYRIYEFDIGAPVTLEMIRTRVHPEDIGLIEKMRMVDLARSVGKDFEWHWRLMMPDHSMKYLHAIAHPTWSQDGQLEYITAVQDVTARRMSEEALAKARSELANVARATSLGVLTASIAHEVNQPLSGIITNASTCLRMLSGDPPNIDGARETAKRTIRDGNRAADVITRLRLLYSKKDLSPELMDLNEVAREVASLSLSELQHNRVILNHEFADHLPPVTADRVQLQQVILNLIRNASDAMSTVDDRPRELLVKTERVDQNRVCLSVKDAGVGFTPQSADKLFEAFYSTKNDGMGIGLSISRSIIEAHHGRLWATANDGPGATFSFAIPCKPEALPEAATRVRWTHRRIDAA